LASALAELAIPMTNTVGVGDAENDHSFLQTCGCAVAVANALPSLKDEVDFTTRGDHGAGVAELAEELIRTDLNWLTPKPRPAG
jgi:hydroxymethylpyrimidine pyrophosphatase-like HAD family hydrolase